MSTFLGNKSVGGDPLLHMSSDTQTAEQLDSDPGANTVFHSDLPYVFVRERFEIDSYTTWSGSDGGRKFTLPTDLKTFRTNNPDLAYLLMMEDSSGNKWIHDPLIDVRGSWYRRYEGGSPYEGEAVGCLNGGEYQVAYTSSNSQLAALTQNEIHDSIAWTFRTWETSDTHVTVFKTPFRDAITGDHPMFWFDQQDGDSYDYLLEYMTEDGDFDGTDLESVGLDVTKVTFLFLNVTHSSTTFERQANFSYDHVKLNPDEFKVNSIDLADFVPLVTHGFKTENTTITPYTSGDLVSGKAEGVNIDNTKINSSDKLTGGDSAVLEILPDPGTLSAWEIDLHNQVIERNGVEVFNSTWASRALFVAGEREISFDTSVTLTDATVTSAVSSTQTGSIGSVDSNTVYLASIVWGGSKVHSTSLMVAGDNLVGFMVLGEAYGTTGPAYTWDKWCNNIWYYLNISSSGVCTVKCKYEAGDDSNVWGNVSSVGLTLPSMTIRLISLVSL